MYPPSMLHYHYGSITDDVAQQLSSSEHYTEERFEKMTSFVVDEEIRSGARHSVTPSLLNNSGIIHDQLGSNQKASRLASVPGSQYSNYEEDNFEEVDGGASPTGTILVKERTSPSPEI